MKREVLKNRNVWLAAEMFFTVMTLSSAMSYTEGTMTGSKSDEKLLMTLSLTFFFMAVTSLFRAQRMRLNHIPAARCIMKSVQAAAFLVCGILPWFVGFKTSGTGFYEGEAGAGFIGDIRQIVGSIFWASMLFGRIVSIILDHRWRMILLNTVLIIVIFLCWLSSFYGCEVFIALFIQSMLSLGAVIAVSFSRLRLDVLKDIIRKTYAAEIISGLLLLIFAFSYMLEFIEESIGSFEDGLWYCFAIVTTIGFGDVTVKSTLGRVLSVILGIYGTIVVALITSVIVNFYGEMKKTGDIGEKQEKEPEKEPEK